MRLRMLNAEQFDEARQILRDIDSLDSHTAFLFDKINFLMDATVGFINISQNKIIKDPSQNINWVTPEGGGGPNYPNM